MPHHAGFENAFKLLERWLSRRPSRLGSYGPGIPLKLDPGIWLKVESPRRR